MARRELYDAISELLAKRAEGGQEFLSRSEISAVLGAPPATVLRYLDKLIGEGNVERVGATSAARYRLLERKAQLPTAAEISNSAAVRPMVSPGWSKAAAALIAELSVPLSARQPISYQRHF